MLSKLNFDLNEMNSHCASFGSINEEIEHEGKWGYIIKIDYDHNIWSHANKSGIEDIDYVLEHKPGVYESLGGNFHLVIEDSTNVRVLDDYENITTNGDILSDDEYLSYLRGKTKVHENIEMLPRYGVCDNVEQVLELYKSCIDHSTNKFVISLMPITKSSQPDSGGWRWEKWGEYYGIQNPQCEYIYDEPEIEKVFCFHIHVVQEK